MCAGSSFHCVMLKSRFSFLFPLILPLGYSGWLTRKCDLRIVHKAIIHVVKLLIS